MAVMLAVGAVMVHVWVVESLDTSIRQSLSGRGADVRALVNDEDAALDASQPSALTEGGASLAQVLDRRGRLIDSTPTLRDRPLLTPAQAALAARVPVVVDVHGVPGAGNARTRLLAEPAGGRAPGRVVVVGASLENRDDAVDDLTALLVIGGPIALLLAAGAGYWVASSALRPVEEMRARAAAIPGSRPGERLPLPAADDEVRRLGATLNDLLERTDAALAHERAFVADASHELRTPLAVLKTELELALRGDHSAADLRAAIESAGEETDRLVRLAEDLLVVARADQGGLPVRPEPLAAEELLHTAAARHAAAAAERGRELAVVPDDGIVMSVDRARIEQALSNLVENALRHGAGVVRLSARAGDGRVELHVADEGPGLDPGFREHAFDRFARFDAARAGSGSGLGLAIVRAVARAHGGEAHLDTAPGGGLDAWMSLPASGPAAHIQSARTAGSHSPPI